MQEDDSSLRLPDFGQVFDRDAELLIDQHVRPHWMQAGTITFVTMRLADSIPREVIERWDRERLEYLLIRGISCQDWRVGRSQLSKVDHAEFEQRCRRLREDELDTCHGRCVLRDPTAAKMVADALLHFDQQRYLMGDFVVMPNHVHLLAGFPDSESMRKQCYSWMKFSATQINRLIGQKGSLWQEEPFDHLVRSEKQLVYLRSYIEQNPIRAKLGNAEYFYRKSNRSF